MVEVHATPIVILDFGSQYTQLIARRVRELGVYCEIHPFDVSLDVLEQLSAAGIILSGGPETTLDADSPKLPAWLFQQSRPILGICYGMQAMAGYFGGEVVPGDHREFGQASITITQQNPLLHIEQPLEHLVPDQSLGATELGGGEARRHVEQFNVWMSHGDRVETLPKAFACIASSDNAPIAAMMHLERPWYGLQFHPEVTHTKYGMEILRQFAVKICNCQASWTAANIVEDAIQSVRDQVGQDHVLLGLSGGVDSSVVAALLHQAIGDQLTCVFVDNGLLRLGESDQVMATFAENMGVRVVRADAAAIFYKGLAGVTDPEAKRKVIGRLFIEVFDQEAKKIDNVKWLAQGTIYPDVIESAAIKNGKAHVIKSHHNVGGLPEQMNLQLLEPLRELFKDEVRRLGVELGLPAKMVYRHPFPGPGLGVRILGEVKAEYAKILRQADHIFIQELVAQDFYNRVSQAFAVFLPVKSVGVVGDARQYEYVVSLRAVETIDFMTAQCAALPLDFLQMVANRITNEVRGVSRVTYDLSSKPPSTIEWE